MCRITVCTTLEEHAIYVEEWSEPHSLVYFFEGEDPGLVERQAWRHYLCRHSPCSLQLELQPGLPPWRLHQVARGAIALLRNIFAKAGAGKM